VLPWLHLLNLLTIPAIAWVIISNTRISKKGHFIACSSGCLLLDDRAVSASFICVSIIPQHGIICCHELHLPFSIRGYYFFPVIVSGLYFFGPPIFQKARLDYVTYNDAKHYL